MQPLSLNTKRERKRCAPLLGDSPQETRLGLC